MRKNKFVKVLEGILLSLPLLYVGVTCLYVANNKNAKDSYYGDTINDSQYINVSNKNDLKVGETYYLFNANQPTYTNIDGNTRRIYFSDLVIDEYSGTSDFSNATSVGFFATSNGTIITYWFDSFGTQLASFSSTNYKVHFKYVSNSLLTTNILNTTQSVFYLEYNNYSFLDNALPYSMSEFNKLGFNKIPFTSFFTNIFHNGDTNVYIDFLNSYLNYMLLVECTYVVPMVLYWFIHIGENILERFTHKEF